VDLLLDTHTFLWFVFGSIRMSEKAEALIQDPANRKFLSLATPWEVGIKVSTGKLTVSQPVDQFFAEEMYANSVQMLPITLAHIARVSTLPFHHRDPFDRILIAQSLTENMALVSADAALDAYSIVRLW
jgi:PIN domain nuclease of toxin-antitoxin system